MRSSRAIAVPLIKSLLFVLVTGLATAILAVMVASADFGDRATYHAVFTDVTGVNPGDSVRIAGVRVGQVDAIELHGKRLAKISFSVERGRSLPVTVNASIKYLNLVGQRYIDLRQAPASEADLTSGGAAPGQTLAPGDVIPEERTKPALNLTELFRGFRPLMQALNPKEVNKLSHAIIQTLQGEGGTVESLIRTIASLTTTLANREKLIGDTIKNLSKVTDTVGNRSKQLTQLVLTLKKLVSGLAADRKPIGEGIVALGDLAETGADFLDPPITPLLQRNVKQLGRLATNLDRDRPLVEAFLQRLPGKMDRIGGTAAYGSWANFYLCQARVTGVRYADDRPPPKGVIVNQPRCGRDD